MASSDPSLIPAIAKWIWNIRPKTVLDVGCGFGRYGFLCREILEVYHGRYTKDEWKTKIDAVEIFYQFINTPVHQYLYDNIMIGDIRKIEIKDYDLIILGDILEHMPKEDGLKLVEDLRKKCSWLLIQTPFGEMKQKMVFNNPSEEHVSFYYPEDFSHYYGQTEMTDKVFAILIRGEL